MANENGQTSAVKTASEQLAQGSATGTSGAGSTPNGGAQMADVVETPIKGGGKTTPINLA